MSSLRIQTSTSLFTNSKEIRNHDVSSFESVRGNTKCLSILCLVCVYMIPAGSNDGQESPADDVFTVKVNEANMDEHLDIALEFTDRALIRIIVSSYKVVEMVLW